MKRLGDEGMRGLGDEAIDAELNSLAGKEPLVLLSKGTLKLLEHVVVSPERLGARTRRLVEGGVEWSAQLVPVARPPRAGHGVQRSTGAGELVMGCNGAWVQGSQGANKEQEHGSIESMDPFSRSMCIES